MIKSFFAKQCSKLSKEMLITLAGSLFQYYVQQLNKYMHL